MLRSVYTKEIEMDVKIKEKWLEALRSGKYRQTRGKLKSRNGAFCCLGVLCDIQGAKWIWKNKFYSTNGDEALPPKEFSAGISDIDMPLLTSRNDGSGHKKHSFVQIADYIEANL